MSVALFCENARYSRFTALNFLGAGELRRIAHEGNYERRMICLTNADGSLRVPHGLIAELRGMNLLEGFELTHAGRAYVEEFRRFGYARPH